MAYLISDLRDSVSGMLSGIDTSNVTNFYGCLERAFRTELQKIDIPEASIIENVTLYWGVTNYAIDQKIYGTAINDIRPQGISRSPWDEVVKTNQEDFDRVKGIYRRNGTIATFEYNVGVPTIRIVAPFPPQGNIIDPMNAVNGWVAGGIASNLVQDTTVFYQSPASLRFTLTGTGAGTLTETINPISLSSYQGVGIAFLAIEMPATATATNLTSITLRLGSSSGNYNSVTQTTGFLGAWQSNNWLLVAFDFSTASTTGTPNWSAISYVDVIFNTTGTITNFRVGGLWISQPSPAQILFQSAAIYLPQGSTVPLTTITADTDQILLTDPAYTIYEYESAISVCEQTGGSSGSGLIGGFQAKLNGARTRTGVVIDLGLYDLYRGDNPSEQLRKLGSYYDNGRRYGGGYYCR